MPVTLVKSKWSSGNLIFTKAGTGATTGISFGEDGTGLDIKFFGDTASSYMLWDQSADQLLFDAADIQLGDTDFIKFGDATGGDVSVNWTGSLLQVSPAADDTGSINIGDGTKDIDLKWFGGTASDSVLFDVGNKAVAFAGDMRLDLSSCTVLATNTDGGVLKCGTSSARVTEDTANMKFMSLYFDNGATSGDNRGMYIRLYLTGAGGAGEVARFFTTVEDVAAAGAHGIHASLNFGSTGSITGLGAAIRGTIHVPNAVVAGTYAAIQAEIWGDGASSSVSGATEYSFFRAVVDGSNAAVKATVDTSGYLFSIQGLSVASGKLFQVNTAGAASHALRIKIGATPYYIMLTDTGA